MKSKTLPSSKTLVADFLYILKHGDRRSKNDLRRIVRDTTKASKLKKQGCTIKFDRYKFISAVIPPKGAGAKLLRSVAAWERSHKVVQDRNAEIRRELARA